MMSYMYLEVQRDKPLFFFFGVSDLTDDGYIGNAFVIIVSQIGIA